MRFQNFWEDFVDFLDSVVSQAKRILFDSNKIVCPELSRSGQASAFIKKKKPDCKTIGFQKTNYGKSNVAIVKNKRSVRIFFRYGLDEI